jgi:hypothetical protein
MPGTIRDALVFKTVRTENRKLSKMPLLRGGLAAFAAFFTPKPGPGFLLRTPGPLFPNIKFETNDVAGEIKMYPPNYYTLRATELEAMSKGIRDLVTREMCVQLARRFRDIADGKTSTQRSDIEAEHLAERMVGKATGG